MGLEIETVKRLIWQYWEPEKTHPEELRRLADDIMKMARQASCLDTFKSELARMQVERLHQKLDTRACDDIATRVFAAAHA